MKTAVSERGEEMYPRRGASGLCPGCGGEMVPVICTSGAFENHWRHLSLGDCIECNREPETGFHAHWKSCAPPECREKVIRRNGQVKRADIKPRTRGSVIEVQHSPLTVAEVRDRDEFYGAGLVWLWDSDGRRFHASRVPGADFNGYPEWRFQMSETLGQAFDTNRTSVIDLGDDLARLIRYSYDRPDDFRAIVVTRKQMENAIGTSCLESDPVLADFLKLKPLKASDVNRRKASASGRHSSTKCWRQTVESLQAVPALPPTEPIKTGRTLARLDQPADAPWIDRTAEIIADAKRWCDVNLGMR